MDFERFKEWAKEEIASRISLDLEEDDLVLENVSKIGRSYTGLTVRTKDTIMSPTVDLDAFYDMYSGGVNADTIARLMTRMIEDHMPDKDIDMEWLSDYESVRSKLIVCLSNAESNSALLKDVPHIIIEDLALTCHIIYELPGEGKVGAVVSNHMLEDYGIDREELFADAFDSSMKLLPLQLGYVRDMVEGGETCGDDNPFSKLLIVSNDKGFRGAACLFYPGTAEKIACEMEGSFYVLPSSIHEVLIIPASPPSDVEDLELMVMEANLLHVPPEERLSDNVYLYDVSSGKFMRAGAGNTSH